MKFQPMQDYVLIQRLKTETNTPGGIAIPSIAEEKSNKGKVIAAGPGKLLSDGELRKMEVKVGDLVLFGPSRIEKVTVEGKSYIIMSELNILAVIEK